MIAALLHFILYIAALILAHIIQDLTKHPFERIVLYLTTLGAFGVLNCLITVVTDVECRSIKMTRVLCGIMIVIQYFFRRYANATNLVNVDIGGGTTDIAFARDKEILYVTSFRFAANSVFENSFSDVDMSNGIVDCYKEQIHRVLTENKLTELLSIFNSENNVQPSNMASFLFTLKENSMVRGLDSKYVDFNHMLQDDENFKVIFILFYSAIIYHVAQIIKAKDLEMPRHISFSGNGSKLITVLTTDEQQLAAFTKLIIERVVGRKYDKELEILGFESGANPKESTCKGGLLGDIVSDDRDKIVIKKAFGPDFISKEDTYDHVKIIKKQQIT